MPDELMQRLDVLQDFSRIKEMYESKRSKDVASFLITGDFGTGKTFLLRTAPKPVLVHGFDPGGTRCLKEWIDKGEIYVTTFEEEENAYEAWAKEVNHLQEVGFFNHVGTYAIDSLTTLADSMMAFILSKAGRTKGVPQQNDYMLQINAIRDMAQLLTGLPCLSVLTAHLEPMRDEATGVVEYQPLVTGKARVKVPLMFDEVYVMQAKEVGTGATRHIEYSVLTQATGRYSARSRIGANEKFNVVETPDLKVLLRKAGLPCEDLEIPKGD